MNHERETNSQLCQSIKPKNTLRLPRTLSLYHRTCISQEVEEKDFIKSRLFVENSIPIGSKEGRGAKHQKTKPSNERTNSNARLSSNDRPTFMPNTDRQFRRSSTIEHSRLTATSLKRNRSDERLLKTKDKNITGNGKGLYQQVTYNKSENKAGLKTSNLTARAVWVPYAGSSSHHAQVRHLSGSRVTGTSAKDNKNLSHQYQNTNCIQRQKRPSSTRQPVTADTARNNNRQDIMSMARHLLTISPTTCRNLSPCSNSSSSSSNTLSTKSSNGPVTKIAYSKNLVRSRNIALGSLLSANHESTLNSTQYLKRKDQSEVTGLSSDQGSSNNGLLNDKCIKTTQENGNANSSATEYYDNHLTTNRTTMTTMENKRASNLQTNKNQFLEVKKSKLNQTEIRTTHIANSYSVPGLRVNGTIDRHNKSSGEAANKTHQEHQINNRTTRSIFKSPQSTKKNIKEGSCYRNDGGKGYSKTRVEIDWEAIERYCLKIPKKRVGKKQDNIGSCPLKKNWTLSDTTLTANKSKVESKTTKKEVTATKFIRTDQTPVTQCSKEIRKKTMIPRRTQSSKVLTKANPPSIKSVDEGSTTQLPPVSATASQNATSFKLAPVQKKNIHPVTEAVNKN